MPLPLLPFPPTCSLSPDPSTPHTSRQGATRHVASCAWPFVEYVVEGHPCCRARRLPSLSWLRDALAQADPQRGAFGWFLPPGHCGQSLHTTFPCKLLCGPLSAFLWSGTAGSYSNSVLNFLETFSAVSHKSCCVFHPRRNCTRAAISPCPGQHSLFSVLDRNASQSS